MSLLALQTELQDYILGGKTDIAAHVASPDGIDAAQRLNVYHHAYRARLGDVLREMFDKTWSWLGDEAFAHAIATYVEINPSIHPSLDAYGAGFSDHLATLWPDDVEASELAWLDRAMRRVFDGPDADPVDPAFIAALLPEDWDRCRIVFHPTLVTRRVQTHIAALWSRIEGNTPSHPALPEPDMAVRVWRKGLQPHFRMIDAVEVDALAHLSRGDSFAGLCEQLAHDGGDQAVDLAAGLLTTWLADELIVDIRV